MTSAMRRLLAVGTAFGLVLGGAVLVDAAPAEAFGYNRAVSRACGQNWVNSSGSASAGSAKTSQHTGSCTDVLYAGLDVSGIGVMWSSGGSANTIAQAYRTGLADTTGRHKGCASCAVTLS